MTFDETSETFHTIVRKDRRITVPKMFKAGEPVEVTIKKLLKEKTPIKREKHDPKRNIERNREETTRL